MAESEWGKLNSGQTFGVLTTDVDRALACAGLTMYEAILMQYIREHSWGTATRRKGGKANPWPDAVPVALNFSRLASTLDVPRQKLQQAKRRLIDSQMLVERTEGLLVNKRADQWTDPNNPEKPRLSPAMLAYAAMAIDADSEPGKRQKMDASTAPLKVHQNGESPCMHCTAKGAPGAPLKVHQCTFKGAPAYKDRAQKDSTRLERGEEGAGDPPPPSRSNPLPERIIQVLDADPFARPLLDRLPATIQASGLDLWRWVRAAEVLVDPARGHSPGQRGDLSFLSGIARRLRDDERPQPATPAPPARVHVAPDRERRRWDAAAKVNP